MSVSCRAHALYKIRDILGLLLAKYCDVGDRVETINLLTDNTVI